MHWGEITQTLDQTQHPYQQRHMTANQHQTHNPYDWCAFKHMTRTHYTTYYPCSSYDLYL